MGMEYTIKRKSFSQTYSTRHLTRLLCFFTTNLRVINKNNATKNKMYIIYLYFCWGLVIMYIEGMLLSELKRSLLEMRLLEYIFHNQDKTYLSINLKTLICQRNATMSLHVPTLLLLDSQSSIQETVLTTFYDYLRRLVSLHMVKTFMSIDITNLLNLLARITNWKSLFWITLFPDTSIHGNQEIRFTARWRNWFLQLTWDS